VSTNDARGDDADIPADPAGASRATPDPQAGDERREDLSVIFSHALGGSWPPVPHMGGADTDTDDVVSEAVEASEVTSTSASGDAAQPVAAAPPMVLMDARLPLDPPLHHGSVHVIHVRPQQERPPPAETLHEAPSARSDATYIATLIVANRQVVFNVMLLLLASGLIVGGVGGMLLFAGAHTSWGVVLSSSGATAVVAGGTVKWMAHRFATKRSEPPPAPSGRGNVARP
jgi:hypothetical protein